ncbi:MAG: response regulator [Nitrospiraceae bacterium]
MSEVGIRASIRAEGTACRTTMPTRLPLLLREDSPMDAELMLDVLREGGFELTSRRVDSQASYLRELDQPPDCILSDFSMPQFTALDALRLMHERGLDIPFIVVSGSIGEERDGGGLGTGLNLLSQKPAYIQ